LSSQGGNAETARVATFDGLGDFDVDRRFVVLAALAVPIGIVGSLLAVLLLALIGLFTNLFYYGRFSFQLVSPADNTLGVLAVLVPSVGGLIVGLMARFGSDKIRGHGIPEAIEAILINRSRVEPRVAVLKPLSSAVSIGSGGPFGAEGPIIMTGGAFGSLVGQLLHLTAVERKTLLVAGAAAGMSATFDSPIAATLLAVELLLFEWRPRSMIPVAAAALTAAVCRHFLLGSGPLFPVPTHTAPGIGPLVACVGLGIAAGALSATLTQGVYLFEDLFGKLPVHWMWWPAIGGIAIGIGGLIFPRALGVGYDTLGDLLNGDVVGGIIVGVLVVKGAMWMIALGSGTSGGVLAPLLMMGAALGGVAALFLPDLGPGFWPLVGMGAILGGTMRVPFTAVVFTLELTHDLTVVVPLAIAVVTAYAFTVLVMKRSILTEKLSRRGHHLSREYSVDPLEQMFVRQVMRTKVVALPASTSAAELAATLNNERGTRGQGLYPVVDDAGAMLGVVTRRDIDGSGDGAMTLADIVRREPIVTFPDETLRGVANLMAEFGVTRLPVVDADDPTRVISLITLRDLLQARSRSLREERERERVLRVRTLVRRPQRPQRAILRG
jgi:H+/Cl- antiporter ClcA/CBS domain-containing protein